MPAKVPDRVGRIGIFLFLRFTILLCPITRFQKISAAVGITVMHPYLCICKHSSLVGLITIARGFLEPVLCLKKNHGNNYKMKHLDVEVSLFANDSPTCNFEA